MSLSHLQIGLRYLLGAFFIFAGSLHFARSEPFVAIVPPYLPYPLALVLISGFFEILGGVGVLIPRTRFSGFCSPFLARASCLAGQCCRQIRDHPRRHHRKLLQRQLARRNQVKLPPRRIPGNFRQRPLTRVGRSVLLAVPRLRVPGEPSPIRKLSLTSPGSPAKKLDRPPPPWKHCSSTAKRS